MKVRKTLAASLGELAMIIGPENARRDLVDVWWDAMRCAEDGDIRLKAIEALPLLVNALGEGEARATIFSGLVKLWEEGWLRNWRAREGIIKVIPDLVGAPAYPESLHRILKWGLEDDFGAVREVSISVVSGFGHSLLGLSKGCPGHAHATGKWTLENCTGSTAAQYPRTSLCCFISETHDVRNLSSGFSVAHDDIPDTLLACKHWPRHPQWIATWQTNTIGELLNNSPVTASLASESASLVSWVVFSVCMNYGDSSSVLIRGA